MAEERMQQLLKEVSEKASTLGIDLEGFTPHIVQHGPDGANIIYSPPRQQLGADYVIISCKETTSGVEIIGHNSSSLYGMNKMCRKLGVKMPSG